MASDHDKEPGGLEKARLYLRQAGYCVLCDRIVEREKDGSCPAEHPAEAVTGRIPLDEDESLPCLPRFNLAAFLIPPIWGPAHGQWAGAVFLPIWLFVDSIVATAGEGPLMAGAAAVVVAVTLAFQAVFARRANGMAYRRVWDQMTVDEFVRRQRLWAFAAVPVALLMLGWAVYFRLVMAPTLPPRG